MPKKITYRTTHDSISISVDKELTLSWNRRGSALKYLPSTQLGSPKNFAFRQVIMTAQTCCGSTKDSIMGDDTRMMFEVLKDCDGDVFNARFGVLCLELVRRTIRDAKRVDVAAMSVAEMEAVVSDWSSHDLSIVRQTVGRLDAELPKDAPFRGKLDLVMRTLATVQR